MVIIGSQLIKKTMEETALAAKSSKRGSQNSSEATQKHEKTPKTGLFEIGDKHPNCPPPDAHVNHTSFKTVSFYQLAF